VVGKRETGQRGEGLAEAYLEARGHRVISRNFRCRAGEIDLVVADGDTVVFVEVRTRRGTTCGTPTESVDARKQARVIRVARYFLAARGWGERAVRFDVVGVRLDLDPPAIEHVRSAFDVVG
jgi:putative endonuclease